MMSMYTIRDIKAAVYNTPFFAVHNAEATRSLQRATMDDRTNIWMCPEDFELYLLGSYDEQTGKINQLQQPEWICNAKSLQKEKKNESQN